MARRASNLTPERVEIVVVVIQGWTGRLTWPALVEAVAGRLGETYTRQALHRHECIRTAYENHRAALAGGSSVRRVSAVLQAAYDRIARLEQDRRELQARENRLLGQIARWAYNASIHGLTAEILDRPLPPIYQNKK